MVSKSYWQYDGTKLEKIEDGSMVTLYVRPFPRLVNRTLHPLTQNHHI